MFSINPGVIQRENRDFQKLITHIGAHHLLELGILRINVIAAIEYYHKGCNLLTKKEIIK